METTRKQKYTVRVIPIVTAMANDEAGNPVAPKVSYIKKSNPNEKAQAKGYKSEEFLHLELFRKGGDDDPLAGDVKPFTLNVFSNSNSILFDAIEDLVNTEGKYDELKGKSKARILKNTIPGLVVKTPCAPYYPMVTNKTTGVESPLMANKKQPDGNYLPEKVILENVEFFMFDSQVPEDQDEFDEMKKISAVPEIARALRNPVTASSEAEVVVATAEAEVAPVETEDKIAA